MTVLGMRARIVTGGGLPPPALFSYFSSRTGRTIRPNVLFVTPANEAYQATAAVAIPSQPPAWVIPSLG
jgi:hypothetical protein